MYHETDKWATTCSTSCMMRELTIQSKINLENAWNEDGKGCVIDDVIIHFNVKVL